MILRQETAADSAAVLEFLQIAYGRESEAKLANALRKNKTAFIPELSIVAEKKGKIIGHILFTKIEIKDHSGNSEPSLSLAMLAVHPDFQKMGIGGKLIRRGLKIARNKNFNSVIALGNENYFSKFGFKTTENWEIKSPHHAYTGDFLGLELFRNGLKDIVGTVIYPKEFDKI